MRALFCQYRHAGTRISKSVLDHEAHDLVRGVTDAQLIRRLRVIDLVEILIDDLEELLFLGMAGDEGRR